MPLSITIKIQAASQEFFRLGEKIKQGKNKMKNKFQTSLKTLKIGTKFVGDACYRSQLKKMGQKKFGGGSLLC